jgi:hypothetical protein
MEFEKKLDQIADPNNLKRKFDKLIIETSNEAKRVIGDIAYDTGDMKNAVTVKLSTVESGMLVGEIFVDPTKLYNKRRPYQYKRGARKGSFANPQRNYPVYVHKGTVKMSARPYFIIAWNNIKTSNQYREFAKGITTGVRE